MPIVYRIPLRIVFYKEEGEWIAHCLEFDLCGDGVSKAKALESLSQSIRLQVNKTIEFNNWDNLFTAADPEICSRFFGGRDVSEGNLKLLELPEPLVCRGVEFREYDEEPPVGVHERDLVEAS